MKSRPTETVLHRFTNYKDIHELSLTANMFSFSAKGKIVICDIGTGQVLDTIAVNTDQIGDFSIDEERGLLYLGMRLLNSLMVRNLARSFSSQIRTYN